MFVRIVRVDAMSHVGRDKEALPHCSVVLVERELFFADTVIDSLRDFGGHIGISSLGTLRANFFVVKQHYHAYFCIVLGFLLFVHFYE